MGIRYQIARLLDTYRNVVRGVKNVIRWIPVIWDDYDWDYAPLANIMRYKILRMARVADQGIHTGSDRNARDLRICAEILRRMTDDHGYKRGYRMQKAFGMPKSLNLTKHQYKVNDSIENEEVALLCKKLKKIRHWWE